jgi:hypothetical protein
MADKRFGKAPGRNTVIGCVIKMGGLLANNSAGEQFDGLESWRLVM